MTLLGVLLELLGDVLLQGVQVLELAAVLRVDGSVMSVADLKEAGSGFFVKRQDNPSKNMFEKDDGWLDGENVEVLMPK